MKFLFAVEDLLFFFFFYFSRNFSDACLSAFVVIELNLENALELRKSACSDRFNLLV